jgi:hypothetical protein
MIELAELNSLVKSLNKPEKRFFKLLSATEPQNIDEAIKLFDFIEKMDDTEDIYYNTENENTVDRSFNNLNLLYNLILKSQRNFYSESITGFSLNDDLSDLKILLEKAQYKQCRKMLGTLKEKALRYEKFNYLLEVLELEKELCRAESYRSAQNVQYSDLLVQQEDFVLKEKNIGVYYQLYSILKYQLKNNNLNGDKTPDSFYKNFLEDPHIKEESFAISKKSLLLLLKCRALCYTALKQQKTRCVQLQDIRDLVSENSFLFEEMPRHYIDVLYSLANAYIEMNEISKVKGILNEMRAILDSKKILALDLSVKIQSDAYTIELLILTYTGKFKEGHELALKISDFVLFNDKAFNKEDKAVLLFNLANFHIYNNNYILAEKALEQLLNKNDKRARWDLKCYSRIQELVVCFELKQYSKLPLIIEALIILKKEKVFRSYTETQFIEFFENMVFQGRENVSEINFKPLHNELKDHLKNKEDNWVNFFYFNFFAYSGYKSGSGSMKDLINKSLL